MTNEAKRNEDTVEPLVRLVQILLCDSCLQGIGQECHTPGCALFMHRCPDFPIMPELYDVIEPNTVDKAR